MAQVYSFDLDKGTDWSINCAYKQSDCTPINISLASISGKVRTAFDGVLVANFNISITDGVNGLFTLSLPSLVTTVFPVGTLYYDVEIVLGGLVTRFVEGQITVKGEVTY